MSQREQQQERALAEFLSFLEKREVGLLAWGLIDGAFSETELDELAERFFDERALDDVFAEPDQLVELAEDRRLLFSFRDEGEHRYRTRMAETVRLLLRLRQLFPRDMNDRRWANAPELVADARFLIRPRAYPRREIPLAQVIERLRSTSGLPAGWEEVASLLIGERELAEFQVRATARIVQQLRSDRQSGTVVCAGTGSGKTLAFYLPTLLEIVGTLDDGDWVRCMALYPRNELLKDQFTETYLQARRLDQHLSNSGKRKLRIGAFFGPTPRNAGAFDSDWPPPGWARSRGGYVCPLLRCPRPGCEGDLLWLDRDRKLERERLVCSEETCESTVEPDEVVLTRERLLNERPDILFTTTEMLNQRLSDSRFNRLFGVGVPQRQKPRLLLLDEAHTYTGTTGAQAALLFRRWLHVSRSRLHIVGLSATLRDARRFFASLAGLAQANVEVLQPGPDELTQSGMEYLLALRGNPASGTSLLSTTLQATLLMNRTLDPTGEAVSAGLYGRKLFLFTDDLDVTNRLFFYLLDAEGQDSRGNPDTSNPQGSLANLRSTTRPEVGGRFVDGQAWNLCEWIGHALRPEVLPRIGRTSSQDAGVDADARALVATASLEVGFNDPYVGAVLQHKAPLDPAAFLQRKGRAGRNPHMRPWTVVVLSDYGRDRVAYQSYDLLFDPELPPRELPVRNRHVLRMQAVFAMLDWLSFHLEGLPNGSVWQDAAVPASERSGHNVRRRQERIAVLAEELLQRTERREDLARYLRQALRISADDVDAILWSPPRPLLTVVVPTLIRRLRTQWRRAGFPDDSEYYEFNAPLPEFVPRALFQDLNLPEVTVVTDEQQRGDGERYDSMRVAQAFNEFAPGRVSRRFGIRHRYARHWVEPVSLVDAEQDLPIDRFVAYAEGIGNFDYLDERGDTHSVCCVRPWEIRPTTPPRNVLDSANSFLRWRTQLVPRVEGVALPLPASRWSAILAELVFFTHSQNCPIEVRRFALESDATIGFEDGRRLESRVRFTQSTETPTPVALGFAQEADALVLRLRLPPQPHTLLRDDATLSRSLRAELFRHRVRESTSLDGLVNVFGRQWLAQAYLGVVLARSQSAPDVRSAVEGLRSGSADRAMREALDVLFQALPPEDPQGEDAVTRQRGHTRILEALDQPGVLEVLHDAAQVLWEQPNATWDAWLRNTLAVTVGAAVLDAIQSLCPDVDARDVHIDPDAGPRALDALAVPTEVVEVWLTETAVGGGGVLEKVQQRFGENPHRFFDLMTRALEPTDFEVTDHQLTRLLEALHDEQSTPSRAVAELRATQTQSHQALGLAFERLLETLRNDNYIVSHPVVAGINARIVRPGSSPQTDNLLHALVRCWHQTEAELDMEIDAQTFAWLQSEDETVVASLRTAFGLTHDPSRSWCYSALASLLWPRGVTARRQRLWVYNPFVDLVGVEPRLASALLAPEPTPLSTTSAEWRTQLERALLDYGSATLRTTDAEEARKLALRCTTEPIDTGLVLLYPRVRRAGRTDDGGFEITLECGEGV